MNDLTEEQWQLLGLMEEMANAPKEEYGKRQPGERCMYEIQTRRPGVGTEIHEEL